MGFSGADIRKVFDGVVHLSSCCMYSFLEDASSRMERMLGLVRVEEPGVDRLGERASAGS